MEVDRAEPRDGEQRAPQAVAPEHESQIRPERADMSQAFRRVQVGVMRVHRGGHPPSHLVREPRRAGRGERTREQGFVFGFSHWRRQRNKAWKR